MRNKLLFSVLVLVVLQSCTKVVEIDLPPDEPKQVLNCLFNPNETFTVSLTKSVHILEYYATPISDATVVLYEDDVVVENLVFDGTYYQSEKIPIPTKTYKIVSATPDLDEVVAQDYLPTQANIDNVSLIEDAYNNEDGLRMGKVQISIDDDGSKDNYYELEIVRFYLCDFCEEEEIVSQRTSFDEIVNDPVLFNEYILQYYPNSVVFSDDLFNGTTYNLKANFWNHLNGDETAVSYTVFFRSITADYYHFKKRLARHSEFQEGGNILDAIVEPISMYSNVSDGFGIFAGYNELQFEFVF